MISFFFYPNILSFRFYLKDYEYVFWVPKALEVFFYDLLAFLLMMGSKNIFTKNAFNYFKITCKRSFSLH